MPQHSFNSLIRHLTRGLTPLHGEREARALARLIVATVSGRSGAALLRDGGEPFPDDLMPKINTIFRQMKEERMPVQYLLGETSFYDLSLEVTPAVLIPRPETEELVQITLEKLTKKKGPYHLLDIGTGSGALALALARHLPEATVWACDIDEETLEIARRNARKNRVNVHFFRDDILRPSPPPVSSFRCIVSNPPYIPEREKETLQPEVALHEPSRALFVPDDDPLLFYRHILRYARQHLEPDGYLMVECHAAHAEDVASLFRKEKLSAVTVHLDINGKKRFVTAEK